MTNLPLVGQLSKVHALHEVTDGGETRKRGVTPSSTMTGLHDMIGAAA